MLRFGLTLIGVLSLLPIAAASAPHAGTAVVPRAAMVQVADDEGDPASCAEVEAPVPEHPAWAWRMRAFRALDCVTGLVDRALNSAPVHPATAGHVRDEMITIRRGDLEKIRALAWSARDAAARIGQ
jgi:hypothetical protein